MSACGAVGAGGSATGGGGAGGGCTATGRGGAGCAGAGGATGGGAGAKTTEIAFERSIFGGAMIAIGTRNSKASSARWAAADRGSESFNPASSQRRPFRAELRRAGSGSAR